MSEEKKMLIWIHVGLVLLQLLFAGLAIGVNSGFAAVAPVIGTAQSFFPNPWKIQ